VRIAGCDSILHSRLRSPLHPPAASSRRPPRWTDEKPGSVAPRVRCRTAGRDGGLCRNCPPGPLTGLPPSPPPRMHQCGTPVYMKRVTTMHACTAAPCTAAESARVRRNAVTHARASCTLCACSLCTAVHNPSAYYACWAYKLLLCNSCTDGAHPVVVRCGCSRVPSRSLHAAARPSLNSHCPGRSGVNSVTGTSAIALAGRWLDQPRSIRPFGVLTSG